MPALIKLTGIALLLAGAGPARAETLFVTDTLNIGLHLEADIDSPITGLVPGGTALTVLARNGELAEVRAANGPSGWIDGRYLVTEKPARARARELEIETQRLRAELASLRSANSSPAPASPDDNGQLAARLNAQRLKAAELTARLTELKNRLVATEQRAAMAAGPGDLTAGLANWKTPAIVGLVMLIIGMLGGACLLDWLNRRRHGGFRL